MDQSAPKNCPVVGPTTVTSRDSQGARLWSVELVRRNYLLPLQCPKDLADPTKAMIDVMFLCLACSGYPILKAICCSAATS